jgi:polyhydroxybutyrate depolymerase
VEILPALFLALGRRTPEAKLRNRAQSPRKIFSLLVIAALALIRATASAETAGPGNHRIDMQYRGLARSYIVHVPPQATSANALPVILNFHGGGSNAEQQERYSGMDATADRDGFIAAYPNGTGRGTWALTWNAGGCCLYAERNKIDDVGFTKAMLDDLASRVHFDRARVYATGISNGGMMAFRLGVEAPDRIAAIAPVEGALMVETSGPGRPMPLMMFNSIDDRFVPYAGRVGLIGRISHSTRYPSVPSVDDELQRWRKFDDCPAAPQIGPTLNGALDSPDAGNSATRYEWGPCGDGSRIVLWKLAGSGHVWPGTLHSLSLLGRSTRVIDANDQMWQFFRGFSVPSDKRSLERQQTTGG